MTAEPFSIDIGGATLTGLEQGDGLPVVFLHAGVCDKRMWLDQMQAVADAGWRGFKEGERMVVPGMLNKLTAYGLRGAPRSLILPLVRRAMGASKT